jgi:hypothetical protein
VLPQTRAATGHFGSVPDFRDDIKGVVRHDVPTAPLERLAESADTLVEFGGQTIQNLMISRTL